MEKLITSLKNRLNDDWQQPTTELIHYGVKALQANLLWDTRESSTTARSLPKLLSIVLTAVV